MEESGEPDAGAYSDYASLPDVPDTILVKPSEWSYFGRQLFREAVVQLLAANLTHAGQTGQTRGGLLRAKRLRLIVLAHRAPTGAGPEASTGHSFRDPFFTISGSSAALVSSRLSALISWSLDCLLFLRFPTAAGASSGKLLHNRHNPASSIRSVDFPNNSCHLFSTSSFVSPVAADTASTSSHPYADVAGLVLGILHASNHSAPDLWSARTARLRAFLSASSRTARLLLDICRVRRRCSGDLLISSRSLAGLPDLSVPLVGRAAFLINLH